MVRDHLMFYTYVILEVSSYFYKTNSHLIVVVSLFLKNKLTNSESLQCGVEIDEERALKTG